MVIKNIQIEMTADEEYQLVDMVAHNMNWPLAMAHFQIALGSPKIETLVNTWLKNWRAGAFAPMPKQFDTNMEIIVPADELINEQI
jgi:hypothetical protein